jgi:hypothetical protein
MPTGYTSELYYGKDVSMKDYILTCARAFGAFISMRDEPSSTPAPDEFTPEDYHKNKVEDAKEELSRLEVITKEEIVKLIDEKFIKDIQCNKDSFEKNKKLKNKYSSMINEIKNWNPPTKDHEELKKFCIEQLENSLSFDCHDDYYYLKPIEKVSVEVWLENEKNMCLHNISYHTQKYQEEIERIDQRNAWIKALNNSL